MKDYVIMRCGTYAVTLISFNDRGIFTNADTFAIDYTDGDDAKWLAALSKTLDDIPKATREKVVLVVPPNSSVFTKYVTLPDVERAKYSEALRFEFQRNFPGDPADWIWESYKFNKNDAGTFIFAMQNGFAVHLIDTLLRKNVQFSYLCPEILLMQIAIQNFFKQEDNVIIAHVGSVSTLFSVSNSKAQYLRIVPFATKWIDDQIASSQKISSKEARKVRHEQLQKLNSDSNGASFIRYYARQFGQKFHQELKRSELFFYRTISQAKTGKILLSGELSIVDDFFEILRELNPGVAIEPAEKSINLEIFDKELSDEKRQLILHNVFTYLGIYQVLTKNNSRVLHMFSETFKYQVSFQRRHPTYMVAMIIVIFATILGLKLGKQKLTYLESQKLATEAKLRESIIDAQKYNETILAEKRIRESIQQIKSSLYSQDAWLELFNHLQSATKELKCSWIDSFSWHDSKQNSGNDIAHVIVKIFVGENARNSGYTNDIQTFLDKIKTCELIKDVNNINISEAKDFVLSFSFDILLDTNSKIFIK